MQKRISPVRISYWLILLLVVAVVFLLIQQSRFRTAAAAESRFSYYAEQTVVTTVQQEKGIVGFMNSRGRELYLYNTYGWRLGDQALLVVNDHGTLYMYDDEAVSASPAE